MKVTGSNPVWGTAKFFEKRRRQLFGRFRVAEKLLATEKSQQQEIAMEKKQIKGLIELSAGVFLYVLGFIVLVPSALLLQHQTLTLVCAVSICAGAALMLCGIADCSL
ncbi:MAG: hypothetical protein PHO90_01785 [Candidatus Pacebacteria bacterium]|nr:hypothetical protein [Candidatus Paceibacterota bacterium]